MLGQRMAQDTFSYFLEMDDGATGRFEVTIYKGQNQQVEGEGELVWSKQSTSTFPASDWDTFISMCQQAIE